MACSEELFHAGTQASHRRTEGSGAAEFLAADFSTLAAVRGFADAVRQRVNRLDLLINNAGIGTGGTGPSRQTSADGHELRFAVNYLSGFLLTHLLQCVPA